jgi:hypothetical protein
MLESRCIARAALVGAATASALALSGCLIIPLNPDGTPAYGVVQAGPAGAAPQVMAAPTSISLPVRLYPTNEAAVAAGVLNGNVVNHLSGKGTFTLNIGGETLSGEATRTGGSASRSGVASAYGSKGSFAQCQYTMNSTTQGTGRCTLSSGATYQLHIGG